MISDLIFDDDDLKHAPSTYTTSTGFLPNKHSYEVLSFKAVVGEVPHDSFVGLVLDISATPPPSATLFTFVIIAVVIEWAISDKMPNLTDCI